MNEALVNIGVAQLKTGARPTVFRTILGSCVGVCVYDRMKKIGGLAHVLLPTNNGTSNPEKYADTAVPLLIDLLVKEGAKKENLSAKIAGGSSMFKFQANMPLGKIGERNIEVAKEMLHKVGVPLLDEDVGGSSGRVINFFLEDGRLKIKESGKEKILYKI